VVDLGSMPFKPKTNDQIIVRTQCDLDK